MMYTWEGSIKGKGRVASKGKRGMIMLSWWFSQYVVQIGSMGGRVDYFTIPDQT